MTSLKAGQKVASADPFFFLLAPSSPGILVKNLPRPLLLALCPRAVEALRNLVGETSQTCASLSALAALSFTG